MKKKILELLRKKKSCTFREIVKKIHDHYFSDTIIETHKALQELKKEGKISFYEKIDAYLITKDGENETRST